MLEQLVLTYVESSAYKGFGIIVMSPIHFAIHCLVATICIMKYS